jgi:predicted dithiol-disulfide oxidoreductase (DUF899 family)
VNDVRSPPPRATSSRAPRPEIERWKAPIGWEIPWYPDTDDFEADFGVDEWLDTNANTRGDEAMGSTWSYLDMVLGRQEG